MMGRNYGTGLTRTRRWGMHDLLLEITFPVLFCRLWMMARSLPSHQHVRNLTDLCTMGVGCTGQIRRSLGVTSLGISMMEEARVEGTGVAGLVLGVSHRVNGEGGSNYHQGGLGAAEVEGGGNIQKLQLPLCSYAIKP